MRFRRPALSREITSPVLTAKEAANYLKVSGATLNKMVKGGWVVPSQTPGGHYRFTIKQLNEALNSSRKR